MGRSIKKYGFSQVGCPVRIGSTTKEMPVMEIEMRYKKRFESSNDYMTKRRAAYGGITFASLKIALSTKGFHINDESFAINYNLLMENGEYNQLAELLSDKNNLHIIFAKFRGKDKTSMSERNDFGRQSVINSYFALKTRLHGISVPRNLSLMRVFQDLEITEKTGHGTVKIISAYGKEVFDIKDGFIQATIPFGVEFVKILFMNFLN